MAFSKLRILLDKYYNGETSLQEEKEIRRLLKKTGDDPAFEIERQMFDVFEKVGESSKPPADLEEAIMDSLETKWRQEDAARFRQPIRWIGGIAASLLLAFFVFQGLEYQPVKPKLVDTYQDEERAYKATKNVLKFVSQSMNAKAGNLSKLSKINENLTHMNNLKKISKINKK